MIRNYFLLLIGCGVLRLAEGGSYPNRIVGGSLTTIEEYPYQVSLQRNGTHLCGGSIIGNVWILTAAHCAVNRNPSLYTVRSGSTYCNSGGKLSFIKEFIIHERYNVTSLDYDIALVKLTIPLIYNSHSTPVPPANPNGKLSPGEIAVATGWGKITANGQISKTLRKVELPLIGWSECVKAYAEQPVTERMICAGVLRYGGKDACQGDSGGPLVFNGELIGIVSWGFGCAHPDYPGVYTRVIAFREWIKNKTGI